MRARSLLLALALLTLSAAVPVSAANRVLRVGGYSFWLYADPATCSGDNPIGVGTFAGFSRAQCAYATFVVDGGGATTEEGQAPALDPAPVITVTFTDQAGKKIYTQTATHDGGDTWRFVIDPKAWSDPAPGTIRFALTSDSGDTLTGQPRFQFTYNQLGTRTLLDFPHYETGTNGLAAGDLTVRGVTWQRFTKAAFVASDPTDAQPNAELVAANVTVTLTRPDGKKVAKDATAGVDGLFQVTFTPQEIGNVRATAATNYETPVTISTTGVYEDAATGTWKTATVDTESTAHAVFRTRPTGPTMRTSFVSERGWVAPGESYVHTILYENDSTRTANGVTITDTLPANAVYLSANPAPASRSGNTLTWRVGSLAPGRNGRILVTAHARNGRENPRVLYSDLSNTATLTDAAGTRITSAAHGPQVRMQESERLGDRPFPVVLVDYADYKHSPAANGWSFHYRISSTQNPVSLYRHYQNMSFGQLYPDGEVASFDAPAGATYAEGGPFKWSNPYFKGNTCSGATIVPPGVPTSLTTSFAPPGPRVDDGWYQLPGQRQYYGQDGKGTAIAPTGDIDGGCGPTGKIAYDAASASDPDLDFNEFDSDRNCLVDFFEIAFQGRGGNGDSQAHGYDNVWPHSGNLQDTYVDGNGQLGYVSNDQCRDRLERPLWWTDASRIAQTTRNTGDDLKVYSRVGPYNVNPENGTTSVFAHEYGHSLGLPDYYSGDRTTVDYWDLMATDGFQYMSAYSRSQLGWIVPRRARTGAATVRDSKVDTHRIEAVGLDGRPYVVSGPGVHNGDAYYVELPHRTLFDKVPSGKHAMWSTAGNAFGCPGKYVDLRLNTTLQAPEGSALTLSFKSWYEIEWDFDYGFVLLSSDGGQTFTALESNNGTTTPQTFNPQNNVCQQTYGNGITGTSTAKDFPSNLVERTDGAYPEPAFIDDSFDASACAGKACIIRLAYATDTGLAKRGWVLDDLALKGDDGKTYFADSFETERLGTYQNSRWLRFRAGPSPFDHGYYLELRDRTGNDYDSAGQGERHPIDFIPGISIWYTDVAHGDGNNGTDDPPAQITVDPRSVAEEAFPRLSDASFYPLRGIDTFRDAAWVDNYQDAAGDPFALKFGCFTMRVNRMSGLGSGRATASLALTTVASKCAQVLGTRTEAPPAPMPPPPPPGGPALPATGVAGEWWVTIGILLAAAALLLRRPLRT